MLSVDSWRLLLLLFYILLRTTALAASARRPRDLDASFANVTLTHKNKLLNWLSMNRSITFFFGNRKRRLVEPISHVLSASLAKCLLIRTNEVLLNLSSSTLASLWFADAAFAQTEILLEVG